MIVEIDGVHFSVTFATNVQDDSETIEFRSASSSFSDSSLVAAITVYDRSESPLLVHVPGEIEEKLLASLILFAKAWISRNMKNVRII